MILTFNSPVSTSKWFGLHLLCITISNLEGVFLLFACLFVFEKG